MQTTENTSRGIARHALPLLALAMISWPLASCEVRGETRANIRSHLISDADSAPGGFSCSVLGGGGASELGENKDPFWIRETWTAVGVEIRWGSLDQELGAKFWDNSFFESHQLEQFVIGEPGGSRWAYAVWGAQTCGPCPTEHAATFKDYPGAHMRCGLADAGTAQAPTSEAPQPGKPAVGNAVEANRALADSPSQSQQSAGQQ